MPRAAMIRSSGRRRAFWMLRWRFSALFRPKRSRPSRSSIERRKKSPGRLTRPVWSSCSSVFQPAPSMSIPPTKLPNSWDTSRAGRVRAVVADRALVAHDRRAADRARHRHLVLPLGTRAPLDERPDDLRDDVAGLLEDDGVADPDVLAPDLVEVVERRPGDGRAGDLHRAEMRDGGQRPGPSDVRNDVLEMRLDLLRRELVGDRPAWRPGHDPEPLLVVEAIDLDDDAVGLVRQVVAGLAPALGEGDHALDVEAGVVVRIHDEADRLEARQRGRLAVDAAPVVLEELVRPGAELATGRDRKSVV